MSSCPVVEIIELETVCDRWVVIFKRSKCSVLPDSVPLSYMPGFYTPGVRLKTPSAVTIISGCRRLFQVRVFQQLDRKTFAKSDFTKSGKRKGSCAQDLSQEAEGQAGKAISPDSVIRGNCHVTPPVVAVSALFVWKPVSTTSSATQVSAFRAEIASIRPPSGATRTSIGGLQARSRRTGRERDSPDSVTSSTDFSPHSYRSCQHRQTRKVRSPTSVIRGAEVMHTQSNSCEVYSPRPRRRGNAYFQRTLRIRGQV